MQKSAPAPLDLHEATAAVAQKRIPRPGGYCTTDADWGPTYMANYMSQELGKPFLVSAASGMPRFPPQVGFS